MEQIELDQLKAEDSRSVVVWPDIVENQLYFGDRMQVTPVDRNANAREFRMSFPGYSELHTPRDISHGGRKTRRLCVVFSISRGLLNIKYQTRRGYHDINTPAGCQFEQSRNGLRGVGCLCLKWQDLQTAVAWQSMTLSGGRSGWKPMPAPFSNWMRRESTSPRKD